MSTTNFVSYGRTVSKNYQSEKVEITLEVPEKWRHSDVLQLAKYMVNMALDLPIDRRAANTLYREYTMDADADIDELII